MRRIVCFALLAWGAGALVHVRPVQPEELLHFARFRAAAFSGTSKAGAARVMAVHRLVEDRVARGSTMVAALADGEDLLEEEDDDADDEDAGGDGWHPGLEASAPLRTFTNLLRGAMGDDETTTLDQSLDDAKIIGVCDLSRQEFDLPNHSLAPDFGLYLTALAVHPAYRRRGIASRLLDYADAIARDGDLGRLVLHVETDNDAAVGFYEASEFRKERNDAEYKQFATALNLNPELHALYSRPTEP